MKLRHRRGLARSDRELCGQLSSYDHLLVQKAAEQEQINKHRSNIKKIDRRLDSLETNIGRYYSAWTARLPKRASKLLRTLAGSVSARTSQACVFQLSEEEVVKKILESGRYEFLQKPKPNLTALKKNPAYAALVGVKIEPTQSIIISTPHKQQKP